MSSVQSISGTYELYHRISGTHELYHGIYFEWQLRKTLAFRNFPSIMRLQIILILERRSSQMKEMCGQMFYPHNYIKVLASLRYKKYSLHSESKNAHIVLKIQWSRIRIVLKTQSSQMRIVLKIQLSRMRIVFKPQSSHYFLAFSPIDVSGCGTSKGCFR